MHNCAHIYSIYNIIYIYCICVIVIHGVQVTGPTHGELEGKRWRSGPQQKLRSFFLVEPWNRLMLPLMLPSWHCNVQICPIYSNWNATADLCCDILWHMHPNAADFWKSLSRAEFSQNSGAAQMVFHDNVWDVCARMKYWFEISLALGILAKILYSNILSHSIHIQCTMCLSSRHNPLIDVNQGKGPVAHQK